MGRHPEMAQTRIEPRLLHCDSVEAWTVPLGVARCVVEQSGSEHSAEGLVIGGRAAPAPWW